MYDVILKEIKRKAHGKKGMLIVSFGTVYRVISKRLGNAHLELLNKALTNMAAKDYLIIWQLPQEHPYLRELIELSSKHASNVYASHWLDIQSLLAYKGDIDAGIGPTMGFISHCGRNSQIEAHYHGVPLICIPLAYDQMYNAESAAQKQLAIVLDVDQPANSFNSANLDRALLELVNVHHHHDNDSSSLTLAGAAAASSSFSSAFKTGVEATRTTTSSRLNLESVKRVSEAMQQRPKAKKQLVDLMADIERELVLSPAKIEAKLNVAAAPSAAVLLPPFDDDYHAHPMSIDYATMPNGPMEILALKRRKLQGNDGQFQMEITGSIRIPGDAQQFRIVPRSLAAPCSDEPSYPETDQVLLAF